MRFVSIPECNVVEGGAVPELIQGCAHAGSSAISLKSHTVMFLKIAARAKWINAGLAQFGIPDSGFRICDERECALYPFRRLSFRVQRTASLTWPIAREQSFARTRKVRNIFRQWFTGGTGRT